MGLSVHSSDNKIRLAENPSYDNLVEVLHKVGIRTLEQRLDGADPGFPVAIPLQSGGNLVLDLPYPAFLASLDPEGIGVAILDPLGYVRRVWGVAQRLPLFKSGRSALESPIGPLLETSYQGSHGTLYLDGYRYFSAALGSGAGSSDVFVLIVNAQEEKSAKKAASRNFRMASALTRLGKVLTMNHSTQQLCVASVHEIASAAELAAVLLWSYAPDSEGLELVASVGANRLGTSALSSLTTRRTAGCAAELVASTRQTLTVPNVLDHLLTANLEAKFCYLKPGAVSVHPLVISDRLLGVLELIGREGDSSFLENADLHETIAEHVALAMNSAAMLETAERLASNDALTGLPNHRSLHEFLNFKFAESERMGLSIGVIMIDVDHFRSFNEEEGHDVGDEVLKQVADTIKQCLRPYDLAARYGGEEFTVVMLGATIDGVLALSERIRTKIGEVPYVTRAGRERHVSVSLGCAISPDHSKDPAGLLKAADTALYEAKKSGRNRSCVYASLSVIGSRKQSIAMDQIATWMTTLEVKAAKGRRARLKDEIDSAASILRLSAPQREILEALVEVYPSYVRMTHARTKTKLSEFLKSDECRLLVPSLEAMMERHDGRGPKGLPGSKIPLLARTLAVLLALDERGGEQLMLDPSRFDPEIVILLIDSPRAA